MANGIMQSDGTRCWSGATCRKHAGAVFKDSHGNLSTRPGLEGLIDYALANNKFEVYVAERENLEKIDYELSIMAEPDVPVDPFSLPSDYLTDKNVWSSALINDKNDFLPSRMNRLTGDNINTFEPVMGDGDVSSLLDSYGASATSMGLKDFESTIAEQENYGVSFYFSGGKGGGFEVPVHRMTRTKMRSAENHKNWREQTNVNLSRLNGTFKRDKSKSPTPEQKLEIAEGMLTESKSRRNVIESKFVKARFELLYEMRSWDRQDSENEDKQSVMVKRVMSVQRLHDEVYFQHVRERELSSLITNLKDKISG